MGFVTHNVPVEHPDFGKAFPCICQVDHLAERKATRLRKISNLDAYSRFRFENFEYRRQGLTPRQENSLVLGYDFARQFTNNPDGWLLIHGNYGSGKTHLAAAIGNQLLEANYEVIFTIVPDLLDYLRNTYAPSSELSYDELFEKVRNVPVLILDDLGTESPTPWASEKLYQLMNHRYIHRLPTVITTNHELNDLEGRIRSRLQDLNVVTTVQMILPDYRNASAQRKADLSDLTLYRHMTFDSFMTRENEHLPREQSISLRKALEEAKAFAEEPRGWLVIQGLRGCGKTHLAASIANHHQATFQPVLFVTATELLDRLRGAFSNSENGSFQQIFDEVRQSSFLVFDDFNIKTASGWAVEKLFQIVEYRYLQRYPTVFTIFSESMRELGDRFEARFKDRRLSRHVMIDSPPYGVDVIYKRPTRS